MTENQLRAQNYQLLANLFIAPPSSELLTALSKISALDNNSPLANAWQTLSQNAALVQAQDLEQEFHQLFIGLSRGELLPYASYYLTGFLMEKPLANLRHDLNKLAIQRQTDNRQPEDHFSALCEVMALLIHEQNPAQIEFFQRHISPWVSIFFNDLKKAQSANFYRAIAEWAEQFTLIEKQHFEII